MDVGTVNKLSKAAPALVGLAYGYWTLTANAPSTGLIGWVDMAQLAAGYGLTVLAFAAFPHRRRTDLIKAVILVSALMAMGRYLVGHGLDWRIPAGAAVGAIAVMVPSLMERFRSLTRANPSEPFSTVYPNNRRRGLRRLAPSIQPNQTGVRLFNQ